jgi:hypothetical protein
LISPKGWPRRARAAGEMKMGSEEGVERRVVQVFKVDIGRRIRG